MSSVTLTFTIEDDNLVSALNQAADSFDNLATQAESAGESMAVAGDEAESSGTSFGGAVQGIGQLGAGIMATVGVVTMAGGLIDSMANAGNAIQRTDLALNTLTQGKADEWITQAATATGGLVSNADLATAAVQGLGTGVATTSDQFAQIARDGATLGEVFGGGAAQGIQTFENALAHVGQTRPLVSLGMDIQAVKTEYDQLVSDGMDKTQAWDQALMDQANTLTNKLQPAIDGVSSWDKFTTSVNNAADNFKERFATGADSVIGILNLLNGTPWQVTVVENVILGKDPNHDTSGGLTAAISNPNLLSSAGLTLGLSEGMGASGGPSSAGALANGLPGGAGPYLGYSGSFNPGINPATGLPYEPSSPPSGTIASPATIAAATGTSWGALANAPSQNRTPLDPTFSDQPIPVYISNPNTLANPQMSAQAQAAAGPQEYGGNYAETNGYALSTAQGTYNDVLAAGKGVLQDFIDTTKDAVSMYQTSQNLDTLTNQTNYNNVLSAGNDILGNFIETVRGGIQPTLDAAAANEKLAHETLAQQLGVGAQDNVYGTMGATMQQAIGGAESAMKGRKGVTAGDQQAFDDQAKQAMNEYNLATGAATQQSITFNQIETELSTQLAAGKINVQQYASEMYNLANQIKSGNDSAQQLAATLQKDMLDGMTPKSRNAAVHQINAANIEDRAQGTNDEASTLSSQANSMFGPIQDAATKTSNAIGIISTTVAGLPAAILPQAVLSASFLNLVQGAADVATKAVQNLLSQKGSVTIQVTSNVPGSGGPQRGGAQSQ